MRNKTVGIETLNPPIKSTHRISFIYQLRLLIFAGAAHVVRLPDLLA
jgi:hypothetical protein